AVALSVPRQVRQAEPEFARECFCYRGSVGAERRERSRCATELDDEDSRRGLVQSLEMSDQWRRPYRAFETEGSRNRVLLMGAARHRRVAKARGSIAENACQRDQVAPHYRQ